jgi:hypothetical protein
MRFALEIQTFFKYLLDLKGEQHPLCVLFQNIELRHCQ